ncbi:MAG: ATP-binding cassette domain-containing protein [Leucobacter sp.]
MEPTEPPTRASTQPSTQAQPTPSGGDPVLAVHDLHKSFGKAGSRKEVLRGLSLTIPAGSIVSLLGANGAGKTTLVNISLDDVFLGLAFEDESVSAA